MRIPWLLFAMSVCSCHYCPCAFCSLHSHQRPTNQPTQNSGQTLTRNINSEWLNMQQGGCTGLYSHNFLVKRNVNRSGSNVSCKSCPLPFCNCYIVIALATLPAWHAKRNAFGKARRVQRAPFCAPEVVSKLRLVCRMWATLWHGGLSSRSISIWRQSGMDTKP